MSIKIEMWNGQFVGPLVAHDTETTICPFTETPDMVLASAYGGGDSVYIIRPRDSFAFMQVHSSSSFLYHNAPFDVDVIEKACNKRGLFNKWYDTNRLYDTSVLYRLYILAQQGRALYKGFSLKDVCQTVLGIELEKGGERVTFEQFKGWNSLEEISKDHLQYAADDVIYLYKAFFALRKRVAKYDHKQTLLSHHIQVKGDLALNRIYKRGIGFDLGRKERWLRAANKRLQRIQNRLAGWGWVRGQKGSKEAFENAVTYLGIAQYLPRTESGDISSKSKDLEKFRYLEFVDDYIKFQELEKQTTFVRDLNNERIHPRYSLLRETGRTSCSNPNFQQLPRSGAIRSMYKAQKGKALVITDYNAIELACLAEVCLEKFGKSNMANIINEGECLHYNTACSVYQKDKKDVTKDERQFAKIPNFAFPTNMHPNTFIDYCNQYGIDIDIKRATEVKNQWLKTYPEMDLYFSLPNLEADAVTIHTGRVRKQPRYTAFLNTFFQGMAADGAKLALFSLEKQGFSVVGFTHDEIICEVNDEDIDSAVPQIEETLIKEMRKIVTRVKVDVETTVSKRYCK